MKRLHDLSRSDLELSPVWRYEGEIDEVARLHATDLKQLRGDDHHIHIAKTQFVLANGTQHVGFCTPATDEGLDSLQPVILTPGGPVYFWFDEPPTAESLRSQWKLLGAGRDEIFPVHFRCTIPVDGQFITGTIDEDDLTGAA